MRKKIKSDRITMKKGKDTMRQKEWKKKRDEARNERINRQSPIFLLRTKTSFLLFFANLATFHCS